MKKTTKISILIMTLMMLFVVPVVPFERVSVVSALSPACSGVICCANPPDCSFAELKATILLIIKKILELAIIAISGVIAYAGFLYLTAGGNSSKVSQANSMLTKVVIGLIVTLSAYFIVDLIVDSLGLNEEIIKLDPLK